MESQLKAMSEYSEHYLRLVKPEVETVPSVRRFLLRLQRWDLSTAHPLLLRLYAVCRRSLRLTNSSNACG